jgi:hypothetical protein
MVSKLDCAGINVVIFKPLAKIIYAHGVDACFRKAGVKD